MVTIDQIVSTVRSGQDSVSAIAMRSLSIAEDGQDRLNAFTHVDADEVMADAAELDRRLLRGDPVGPLVGTTIAVKDLIDVRGLPTSYGSKAFAPRVAEKDANVVRRLREAGAVIFGKTRTSEFAWGATTPPTCNPLDVSWVAGGSSGGSGAAVGAGFVQAALGTDTGGSVRIPAAVCGVVGYKPTFGLIGRSGVLPGNHWFDHIGPITRSVADARTLATVLFGPDPADFATRRAWASGECVGGAADWPSNEDDTASLHGVRAGVVEGELFEFLDDAMSGEYQSVLGQLSASGVVLVKVRAPELRYVLPALLAADLPDSAAIHTSIVLDNSKEIDGSIRALLELAHEIPAVLVARAHQVRRLIVAAISSAFKAQELDLMVVPGMVAPRVKHEESGRSFLRRSGQREPVLSAYVRPQALASVTGQPAIVIPFGDPAAPMSLQLIGRPFADAELLSIAGRIERRLGACGRKQV